MFPRTGSKTADCWIPDQLPPGAFQQLIDIKITRVETLPKSISMTTGKNATVMDWRERVEAPFPAEDHFDDGWGFHYRHERVHYINACPDRNTLLSLIQARLQESGIEHADLGPGLRIAQRGELTLAFNYGPESIVISDAILNLHGFDKSAGFLIGQSSLPVGELCAWRRRA